MTNREFFTAIVNGTLNEEVIAHAQSSIEKLDTRNASRKDKPSKKSLENEPIKEAIKSLLTEDPMTASEIAEKVEISTQKASALLRQIEGLTVTEVKVKGKGKVKGYSL